MTRTILLAGAMMFTTPVLAQTAPAAGQTGAVPAQTTPAPGAAAPSEPTTAAPTDPVATAPAQSAATPTTEPAPAPAQSQVAQVVDQNFGTYDKDGNGALSKAEFAAWMTSLKTQAGAAAKETPAQATAWNDAAFKQADGDKSATVTKTELTSFLVKGASQPS